MVATSIVFAGAVLALAQQSSSSISALYPEDAETWTLEYPTAITAYVEDYYSCLKAGSYTIGDGLGFEAQYRKDIPRCAEEAASFEKEAVLRLSRSNGDAPVSRADVARIFETVRRVHVARGRSLDRTVQTDLRASEEYRAEHGLAADNAAELGACVDRLRALIQRRDSFAQSRGDEIEARHAKDDFSDEDRAAIDEWTRELSRYASMIAFERSRCPASDYVNLTAGTSGPSVPPEG